MELYTVSRRRTAYTFIATSKGFDIVLVTEGMPGFVPFPGVPPFDDLELAQAYADKGNQGFDLEVADVWAVIHSAMAASSTWSLRAR